MINENRISYLTEAAVKRSASREELQELSDLLKHEEAGEVTGYIEFLLKGYDVTGKPALSVLQIEAMADNVLKADHVYEQLETRKGKVIGLWRRVAVAASIILVVGFGSYLLFFNKSSKPSIAKTNIPQDVKAPETSRAMITLANGQKVLLDSVASGTLATEGKVNVVKTADGQIVYNGVSSELMYNTLYNPRGSKVINLTLSDGTKVWLNSESSLKYPIAFAGNERKVEITGEAYFEVTHDISKPFIVSKGTTSVQVLGTHFNVNTYEDEDNIKVTLLEGLVKVSNGKTSGFLKPGQQAQVSSSGGDLEGAIKVVNGVDAGEVMAWKNGLFKYNNADIGTVMRQISRWYDVTVNYPKGLPKDRYWGGIPRDQSLSGVFKVLEESGAHFIIDGKNVTVLP